MPASVGGAQEWIRYAFQHGVKSLSVDLFQDGFVVHPRNEDEDSSSDDEEEPCMSCHELLRVSAPMLEELAVFQLQSGYSNPPSRLEVDGDFAHVRSLKLL
ncbi:hypothetical protein C2845_PM09G03680 [Panicum miliaceum]|uniref:Uncharacterized protein n=1 Tax=Panicum miliaceum TaxID=4540 RepID=A0A3L6S3W9_PANMI|nr:hypothetical protein C2845_PM09G03680 [Panicum miliaceum]